MSIGSVLDEHRLVRAQEIRFLLQLVGIHHPADHLADTAAEMGADQLERRKPLEYPADQKPGDGEAVIRRAADARCEPVIPEPFLAEGHGGRMDHDRHIELAEKREERHGLVVVGIGSLDRRHRDDASEIEFADGALGLLEERVAAARHPGREPDELVGVPVAFARQEFIDPLHLRELFGRFHIGELVIGIAHHGQVDAGSRARFEYVRDGQGATALPERVLLFFGRIGVGVPVDNHQRSSPDGRGADPAAPSFRVSPIEHAWLASLTDCAGMAESGTDVQSRLQFG